MNTEEQIKNIMLFLEYISAKAEMKGPRIKDIAVRYSVKNNSPIIAVMAELNFITRIGPANYRILISNPEPKQARILLTALQERRNKEHIDSNVNLQFEHPAKCNVDIHGRQLPPPARYGIIRRFFWKIW